MKNPCDICICRVVCTKICPEKENYRALIKNAITENSFSKRGIRLPNNHNFMKYLKMQQQHFKDTAQIYGRNSIKKGEK